MEFVTVVERHETISKEYASDRRILTKLLHRHCNYETFLFSTWYKYNKNNRKESLLQN
jgi:hypothetical protein